MHRSDRGGILTLAAAASLLFMANAWATSPADVVAYVDGTSIGADQLQILESAHRIEHPNAAQRRELVNGLVDRRLLAEQAEKVGLDKNEQTKALLLSARETILARVAVDRYLKQHPVTDKEMHARYDALIAKLPARQYHVRAIVVKSKEDARKIKDELDHGSDFSKLAKEHSLLPDKKAPGGELGWRFAKDFVPPVAAVIRKADKGKPSAPVWTPQGWWMIEVEGTRPTRHKPYAAAKNAVRNLIVNERVKQDVAALRKHAKIKLISAK